MPRPAPSSRSDYRHFVPITTRWMDNDVFGHVNNVVYYSWIDTAVNFFLVERGLFDIMRSPVVSVVAETGFRYFAPISFPDAVTVGLRIATLGRSSVRYELGVFRAEAATASAEAHFVHVYVDRATMRPVPMPGPVRAELETIR